MSGGVAANKTEIHTAADRVSRLAEGFADDIDGLMRRARSVIGAEWLGDAADTHHTAWEEWEGGVRRIVAALSADAVLLHQAAARFGGTDDGYAQALRGLDLP
ncbi:WXG100 family type VII secretion target [Nocardia sp. NBC_01499]|uniref:WXG100 family type VII secretion target n=1 Tax=Nocardia sp. NBC_01499 TaxID=2903597 RepID=UPI003868B809